MDTTYTIGKYRVTLFRKPDNSWNWRACSIIWASDVSPYTVSNACYTTKRDALESAKDWVSQQT